MCVWVVTPATVLDTETEVRGGISVTSNVPSKPSTGVQFSGTKYTHSVLQPSPPSFPASERASEEGAQQQEDCEAGLGKKNQLILIVGSAPRLPSAVPVQLSVWLLAMQKPGS